MTESYDFIVVGAGSAGCALAYRLAAGSDGRVLLLEAGSPAYNPMLHIPLGFAFLLKKHRNNWSYVTRAEPGLNQRQVELPRGKVLGGCSAINGMVYVRGQREDYDRWAALGNRGWAYDEVLPYFKRSEHRQGGAGPFHGEGGPLWVGDVNNDFPVCEAFIDAAEQAGHARNSDFNAGRQAGVGYFSANIKNGRRVSSAGAFLGAGRQLTNLTVKTGVVVNRIQFDGRRAVAVDCLLKGRPTRFHAAQEIVVAAGAINSPKLLELSGVGGADLLRSLKIPLVQHLPGVGENLHDHWNSYLVHGMDSGANYFTESRPLPMLRNLVRYLGFRRGFLANPAALVAVFYKSRAGIERADAQIHFAAAASSADDKGNLVPIAGVMASSCGLRPTSRGGTHVASADGGCAPDIRVNYLATAEDRRVAVDAFRGLREIFCASALRAFGGSELQPGASVSSDGDILDYIRATGEPVHHLVGSCRMGWDDRAVVDDRLRVHGLEGLRVADASVMPEIVSGNTHAACVMIAEKAADLVLADAMQGCRRATA